MEFELISRTCPICSAVSYRVLFKDINRREGLAISGQIVECRTCGMQYLNPAPDPKRLALLYREALIDPVNEDVQTATPSDRNPLAGSFLSGIARALNGALRGHPHDWPEEPEEEGKSILDFGCHDGAKLAKWHKRGWQVAGIDLNEKGIDAAKRRFPNGQFWCGDLPDLKIKERYDFIRSDNVIEHLTNPGKYIRCLINLLNPGGQLRLFVPNGKGLTARLWGRYSAIYWMPFHMNLFSTATLTELLTKNGLRSVTCRTYTPIGAWVWTQRQWLLRPGFNRRSVSLGDKILQTVSLLNYPGETLAQWSGAGEELIATGRR